MRALSPGESRLIAVLLLIAVVALFDLGVVQPLIDGFAARAQQRAILTARYAANERTIAAIPRLSRQAAARAHQADRYTLAAADLPAAADALRDRMQAAANAVGAEFHGAEDQSAAPGMVAARVAFRVPPGKLAPLIEAIENPAPLITINGLAVSADDALVSGAAATLDAKLDIAIAFHAAAKR